MIGNQRDRSLICFAVPEIRWQRRVALLIVLLRSWLSTWSELLSTYTDVDGLSKATVLRVCYGIGYSYRALGSRGLRGWSLVAVQIRVSG